MKTLSYFTMFIMLTLFTSIQAEETTSMKNQTTVLMKTTQGDIEIELFPASAPKTTENFLGHIANQYYDDLIFHRIIPNFMIQGGDPSGDGTGGTSIWNKPFEDEIDPSLTFDKAGLLAMANSGPNTNGSQFFITTAATPWLNGNHTIFGRVVKGYDVIQKIEAMGSPNGTPKEEQKIIKITVKQLLQHTH